VIAELGESGIGLQIGYTLSNFCGFEISNLIFEVAKLKNTQIFRVFYSKPNPNRSKGIYHRCLFIDHNHADTASIIESKELITKFGVDRWLADDMKEEEKT
jgi:hypothetical protein